MAGTTEVSFPRGGRKASNVLKLNNKSRPTFKLFGNKKKRGVDKKRIAGKKQHVEKERFTLDSSKVVASTTAELLSYRTLQESMVVLACIREINKMGLSLSLPGRLAAKVPITFISQPYTNLLKDIVQENNAPEAYKGLSHLFSVGQYVRCKIMESLHSEDNLYKVTASISPQDVQSDWKYSQLKKGLVLSVAVSSVEDHGYVMDTGIKDVRAFLPKNNVNKRLEIGQVIWCTVIEATQTNIASTVVLSAKPKKVFLNTIKSATMQDLLPGMRVVFTVDKSISDGLEGKFLDNFTGYISSCHLDKPIQPLNRYNPGDTLQAYVLYVMPTTKLTGLTLHDISKKPEASFQEGHVTVAKVLSRIGKGLYVKLSKDVKGFVSYNRLKSKKDVMDKEQSIKTYEVGTSHQCRVLDFDHMERMHICTLEKTLVKEQYFCLRDFNIGDLVTVVIDTINANGISVTAGRVSGFVMNLHVSDIPLQRTTTAVTKKFQIGQKVNARVLEINNEKKYIRFTLKPSLVESKVPCLTALDAIDKKLQYLGVIVQITNKGLLVIFYGDVRGWVPTKELNLRPGVEVEEVFYVGQVVKCRILTVDAKKRKMTLSLKSEAKRIKVTSLKIEQKMDGSDGSLELNCKKQETEELKTEENDDEMDTDAVPKKIKKRKRERTDSINKVDNNTVKIQAVGKKESKLDAPILSGMDGFWSLDANALQTKHKETSAESDEEMEPKKKRKASKALKSEEIKSEEARIAEKEMLLADADSTPTSAEQFDRLTLSQPNSSRIWINYMAFHLQSTEIEKARSIAKKALSKISLREEEEKLNVWVALLNLENRYGTKQSFAAVLEEAARMNDSRSVHMRALHILADSEKKNEFTDMLNIVLKKYKHISDTWLQGATHCFQLGLVEKARHLLQRALTCLDKNLHVDFLVQFAHLEVKHGNQERAETLFEQILGSYPKRVDIWCSYVDMLIKASRISVARKVLSTAVSLQLPPRKMKTLFKKFLDFEKSHGDEEGVAKVKEMAANYVKND